MSARAARKLHFTLPVAAEDLKLMVKESAVAARLGLTRDDGCVVTISIDSQVRNSFHFLCSDHILSLIADNWH